MTIRELENLSKKHFYLHQLFSLKRCFGSEATINFVDELIPLKVNRCRTIQELSALFPLPDELLELDAYFNCIPPIHKVLDDDFNIIPDRFNDGGPRSPWDVAREEQELARCRCRINRLRRRNLAKMDGWDSNMDGWDCAI